MNTKSTAAKPATTIAPHHCLCGCGATITTKANYRPGHDARAVSQAVAELVEILQDGGKVTKATIASRAKVFPSEPLKAKFTKAAERMVANTVAAAIAPAKGGEDA